MMLPVEEYFVDPYITLKVGDFVKAVGHDGFKPYFKTQITHIIENSDACETIFILANGEVIQQDNIYERIIAKSGDK